MRQCDVPRSAVRRVLAEVAGRTVRSCCSISLACACCIWATAKRVAGAAGGVSARARRGAGEDRGGMEWSRGTGAFGHLRRTAQVSDR